MLNENFEFNHRSIRSFTSYTCEVDGDTLEKEISCHVALGPSTERQGDSFPVYEVPDGKMVWLSDWSFNSGGPLDRSVSAGGSLGRITTESAYIYVLNCSVSDGEMEIFSPARPIRYLPGEWISICLHHMGGPVYLLVRATFRFTEVPSPQDRFETTVFNWWAKDKGDLFPGQT
jgi:hypothetical protein